MLQNIIDITDICHALIQEAIQLLKNLSHMSPYIQNKLSVFEYVLNLDRRLQNLQATRNKFLFRSSETGVRICCMIGYILIDKLFL